MLLIACRVIHWSILLPAIASSYCTFKFIIINRSFTNRSKKKNDIFNFSIYFHIHSLEYDNNSMMILRSSNISSYHIEFHVLWDSKKLLFSTKYHLSLIFSLSNPSFRTLSYHNLQRFPSGNIFIYIHLLEYYDNNSMMILHSSNISSYHIEFHVLWDSKKLLFSTKYHLCLTFSLSNPSFRSIIICNVFLVEIFSLIFTCSNTMIIILWWFFTHQIFHPIT